MCAHTGYCVIVCASSVLFLLTFQQNPISPSCGWRGVGGWEGGREPSLPPTHPSPSTTQYLYTNTHSSFPFNTIVLVCQPPTQQYVCDLCLYTMHVHVKVASLPLPFPASTPPTPSLYAFTPPPHVCTVTSHVCLYMHTHCTCT